MSAFLQNCMKQSVKTIKKEEAKANQKLGSGSETLVRIPVPMYSAKYRQCTLYITVHEVKKARLRLRNNGSNTDVFCQVPLPLVYITEIYFKKTKGPRYKNKTQEVEQGPGSF